MTEPSTKDESAKTFPVGKWLGVVLGVCVACYGAWAVLVLCWADRSVNRGPFADVAAFGDAFGPVAGLLSTLALAAAITSVFMQRYELQLQRDDFVLTREVFKKQQAAQEELTKAQDAANALAIRQLEQQQKQLEQQQRDHWLAREEQRGNLLQLRFAIWNAGVEDETEVPALTDRAREMRRIQGEIRLLIERERDERRYVLSQRIVARRRELGSDHGPLYRMHNLDRLGHEPGNPTAGWRDDGMAMEYNDKERAIAAAQHEHAQFGDRVVVLGDDGRIAWESPANK